MATPVFSTRSDRRTRKHGARPDEKQSSAKSVRATRGAPAGRLPLYLQRGVPVAAPDAPVELAAQRASGGAVGSASGSARTNLPRTAGPATGAALHSSPGASLDTGVRDAVGPGAARDLDGVHIHVDPLAAAAADELGALAFTRDRDIYFGEGRYRPGSAEGRQLLAHELTHVAQGESGEEGAAGVIHRQIAPLATTSSSSGASGSGDLNYTPADPAQQFTPGVPQPQGPPVFWGLDMSSAQRRVYASVAAPGHTLAEVATYIYGSAEMAGALSTANGGLPERLGPGRTLTLAEGTMTADANAAINRGITDGTIMRSQGIPQEDESRLIMYNFSGGGQRFELTEAQYLGMMQGAFTWIERKARFIRDSADDGKWVHNDHIEGTNSVIRGISDWMGDTECPPLTMWEPARSRANALAESLHDFHVTPASQATLRTSLDSLSMAAESLDFAKDTWRTYINATIEGAGTTVHRLEIVRNVSFGVAAGLAGAVAAPAVFGMVAAAGGGTLLAGGVALGAGTLAGAGTGATLEFGSSAAGVGLSMAVTPGEQQFDWGYVGERTWEGTKSGAIQGGLGAAGALAAPGVSGALGARMFGQSAMEAGTLSAGQQLGLRVATGAAIGLPSGMAGAGIEGIDDVVAGRMSGGDYATSIALGGAMGFGLGGAMSVLPVNGLYRGAGGEPITPRWMLNGPFSPLQQSYTAPPGFENLAVSDLPPLMEGYQWTRLGGTWEPISLNGPMTDPVTVRLYGPDANGRYNYVVSQGGRIVGSRAFTRPTGGTYTGQPGANRWNYPMSTGDYAEAGTGTPFVRGHNIDFADTIDTPGTPLSTMDPMNYTPEQADWGLHVRRILVGDIRTAQGAQGQYRQMEFFDPGSPPRFTTNGRRIPDGVFFAEYSSATGQPVRAWQVRWSQAAGITTRVGAGQFVIPLNQLPPVLQAPVSINAGVSGGAGAEAVDAGHH